MAAINGPQDLLAEGFQPEQFGQTSQGWGAYAQALLDEQTLVLRDRVGDIVYGDQTEPTLTRLTLAERYLACAVLCSRRINRLESSLAASRQSDAMTRLVSEIRANQRNYERMVEEQMARLAATPRQETPDSAPAFGMATSSHFGGGA